MRHSRPTEYGQGRELPCFARPQGCAITRFARVDFVSCAEMLLRQQQIFLADINQSEMIKRRIEFRIHLYAATQVTNPTIGSTIFQISPANKVVHLLGRFEPERAFQMSER